MSTHQSKNGAALDKRNWYFSLIVAAVVVAIGVALSASINPLIGRAVHWDWMAVIAPTLFIVLGLGLRNRWV